MKKLISKKGKKMRKSYGIAAILTVMLFLSFTLPTYALSHWQTVKLCTEEEESTLAVETQNAVKNAARVSVICNGRALYTSQPLLIQNTTYVPANAFLAAFGHAAQLSTDHHGLVLCAKGRAVYCQTPCLTLPDSAGEPTLYAPVRALAALIGADIFWDASSYTVQVTGGINFPSAETMYSAMDLDWLARIIFAESGTEPFAGQIAVGNVVLNRMHSPQYPDTIQEVIFDRKYGVQFTPTSNGMIYNQPSEESILAAKICLEGYSVSEDSLFFLNEALSTNLWTVRNCRYVFSIGSHDFYA